MTCLPSRVTLTLLVLGGLWAASIGGAAWSTVLDEFPAEIADSWEGIDASDGESNLDAAPVSLAVVCEGHAAAAYRSLVSVSFILRYLRPHSRGPPSVLPVNPIF